MSHRRLLLSALLALLLNSPLLQAEEALRPEVGKPLQAAQSLIKAGKYKEALAKIRDADGVSGKSANESLTIERMRFVVANGLGDADTAARSLDALMASGKLSASEQVQFTQAVAVAAYRAKDYGKAIVWTQRYFKEGGKDDAMRTVLVQAFYLNNDFVAAARELAAVVQATEKAGGKPDQDKLEMLASCYIKQNDMGGYVGVLEKLATWYPKKEYWADLLARIQKKPGFPDRLTLDVYRLRFVSGNVGGAGDYMEMAQLALQQGYPVEAKKAVDEGYAKGLLGTGTDVARHQRLRDLVTKQLAEDQKNLTQGEKQAMAAKDGTGLVNIGLNLVLNGQNDKGLALMEQGLAKGGLKRPEDARLHLGYAYWLSGQKAKAVQTFRAVQGSDGVADLARLWALQSSN